jgi:hypothetical protein
MTSPLLPVRTPRSPWIATLVAGLALAVGITILSASGARAAETAGAERAAATPRAKAKSALTLAITRLDRHHLKKAAVALRTYARRSDSAHAAAINLIGKPPVDPESDEPPGPAAILAMIRLDHQATMSLVPRLDGLKRAGTVKALRKALGRTHVGRNTMISGVVSLPPEGAGDDYTDGMSDVLGIFPKEVALIDTGLGGYMLTDIGRAALSRTRDRVILAENMMNGAYGGGD